MGAGHAEVDEQRGHRLRCHRGAPVGVHGVRRRPVPGDRIVDESLCRKGILGRGDDPPRVVPGVDVDQHVQVEPSIGIC